MTSLVIGGLIYAWLATRYSVESAFVSHLTHNLLVHPVAFVAVWAAS